jgi:hypothetical protein
VQAPPSNGVTILSITGKVSGPLAQGRPPYCAKAAVAVAHQAARATRNPFLITVILVFLIRGEGVISVSLRKRLLPVVSAFWVAPSSERDRRRAEKRIIQ